MKKKLFYLLRFLFGFTLLAYLVFGKTRPGEIAKQIGQAYLPFLVCAFSLHAIGLWISAVRWKRILDERGADFSILALMKCYLVGTFFSHFLPSRFGGDAVRIADTRTIPDGLSGSFAAVAYERMSGIFALTLFAVVSALIKFRTIRHMPIITVSLGLSVVGLTLFTLLFTLLPRHFILSWPGSRPWIKKIYAAIDRVHDILADFFKRKRLLASVLFWAFLLQLNVIIHYYFIGRALKLDAIPFLDYFFTIPILLFFLSFPISINGIGVRDWILIRFFSLYGYGPTPAIAFSFIDLIFNLALGAIGGLIYVSRKK